MKFYDRERSGINPFIFGHDYRPGKFPLILSSLDMPEEEIEYINKAVYVNMEERMKSVDADSIRFEVNRRNAILPKDSISITDSQELLKQIENQKQPKNS